MEGFVVIGELTEAIRRILALDTDQVCVDVDGLRLITWRDAPVINVNAIPPRLLIQADVDAFRAALADAGYAELDSWVATQGASWLSDGLFAGVSFRVALRTLSP